MNKLIKPFKLKKSNLKHILFAGTKEYPIPKKSSCLVLMCSLRRKDDPRLSYAQVYGSTSPIYRCQIKRCRNCFYNARNYLNVLKYRKKLLNE